MREAWPEVRFHGCEAHPDLVVGLKREYPGELHGFAISDEEHAREGDVTLYNRRRHKDGSSLFPPRIVKLGEDEIHVVPVTTLDRLFDLTQPEVRDDRVLLWLDCEGSELAALRGGERFIESVDFVNVEMTSHPVGVGCCGVLETHCWLAAHGFKRQTAHTNRTGGGQCDAVYVRERLWRPEYCSDPISFIPKEKYL